MTTEPPPSVVKVPPGAVVAAEPSVGPKPVTVAPLVVSLSVTELVTSIGMLPVTENASAVAEGGGTETFTTIVKVMSALPVTFEARTVMLEKVPATVGVPDRTPLLVFKLRPVGSVPAKTLNVGAG